MRATPEKTHLGTRDLAAFAAGTLILCWIAIANGFPLVFADSGAYLRTALQFSYPTDRPPIYGLAILAPVRLAGVWGIIAVQAAATALLLRVALSTGLRDIRPLEWIAACLALAFGSSLVWFVDQIMPDLATGFIPLVLFALLATPTHVELRWRLVTLTGVFALLVGVHLSHILLSGALLAFAIAGMVVARMPIRVIAGRAAAPAFAILMSVLALSTLNLVVKHEFKPSLSSNMFMTARLLDGRLAQPVLADMCRKTALAHCAVRPLVDDPSVAKPGQAYLWDARSPLWSVMLVNDRDRTLAEQALINRTVIRQNPLGVLNLAWDGFVTQLVTTDSGLLPPYGADTWIVEVLRTKQPASYKMFQRSMQQRDMLSELRFIPDVGIALVVALLMPAMLWWAVRRKRWSFVGLALLALAALLTNAAITGTLSGPDDRYQSRILWLLPLLAIRFVLEWRTARTTRDVA